MVLSKIKPINILTHALLFLLTFFTTTLAGVQWLNKDPFELSNFSLGLTYSISLLIIIAAHEFGHYFAARYHGINTTLPFFIPMPQFINPFGTMGAVIRIRSIIQSRKALFDIGIAGPIGGLIFSILFLLIGFFTLPEKDYIYKIHPEYLTLNTIPKTGFTLGNSILFFLLSKIFSNYSFVPPMNEIYHYPFLCVGWFGLFITALNLIPVGQLDGGHILYALIGKKQGLIARLFILFLVALGLVSILPFLYNNVQVGSVGWLLWATILYFLFKLDHPHIYDDTKLDPKRVLIGYSSIIIFIVTFIPIPFYELT